MTILERRLDEQGWLMADGATGTVLFGMGLAAGEAPELWNRDAPEKVRMLYDTSIEAGADLFLTNSFGGTAARLKLHDAQDDVYDLNARAASIAREAADAAGREVIVAGSMGPTGDLLHPVGPLSHDDAAEMFAEQARGLKEGGADVLWVETISAAEEYRAAADGIATSGLPWCGTMSFDTAGRTMMGIEPPAMRSFVDEMANAPVAFGANCGVGSSDLVRTVLGFEGANRPIIAKGNAGIPKYVCGQIHYDGTPELMADYATIVRDAGAKIIGGCCGTTGIHLRAMRKALEETPPGPRPGLDEIEARLGGFSSASDKAEPGAARPRRRRRA